jgi:hypothetical protein
MEELTYILGAGASYQSMPVVKTFDHRFSVFNVHFNEVLRKVAKNGLSDSTIHRWSGAQLQSEFMAHQSFDTYFKKLFHKGLKSEVNFAKKILHLYFLWEHLQKPEPKINNEFFHKQSQIDKRYDAMIAGLLQPIAGQSKTFCKTNFITWNYDLNLLSSIKTFFYPEEKYIDFLKKIESPTPNIWNIDDQITIINMNGYFYSSLFDDKTDIYDLDFTDILNRKIISDYFDDNYIDKDANLIKFAWERNTNESNQANSIESIAKNKISNSIEIIVIGYTFPLYNRLVDIKYFNKNNITIPFKNAERRLSIQDPLADEILNGTIKQFDLNSQMFTAVMPIKNCHSFLIPNRIIDPVNIVRKSRGGSFIVDLG